MTGIFRAAGIRMKVIGIVLGVTLFFTLVTLMFLRVTLERALTEQLEQKAVSITSDVATRSVDMVLTGNYYFLHRLTRDTLKNNQAVRYVFFIQNDDVIADSFSGGFPTDLMHANTVESGKRFNIEIYQTEEGILRDVAVPVFGDSKVVARVGFLDHEIQTALSSSTRQFFVISILTIFFGSMIAYLLTTFFAIKPIGALVNTVQAVSHGNLSKRVTVNSSDELSELAFAFNDMIEQLHHAHLVRNDLLKKIIQAEEDERRRIARELHDETGQTLMSLMIAVSVLEEAKSPAELQKGTREFRELLLHTLEDVRLLAWKMSPIPLADLGLKAAIELFIKKYEKNDHWIITFSATGFDHQRLFPEIETAIYRVMQEALTNAAKHAEARNVEVKLTYDGQQVNVIVADDGKGFDVDAVKKSRISQTKLGLASMEERIALVGGTLKIDSTPAKGTTVNIIIPIQKTGGENNL